VTDVSRQDRRTFVTFLEQNDNGDDNNNGVDENIERDEQNELEVNTVLQKEEER